MSDGLTDDRPAVRVSAPVCRVEDLPDGASRGFDPLGEGRDTMFIVRRGDALHGWRNHCPHYDNARMAWRKDEFLSGDKSHIVCGAHGALFEIDTGLCVIGPCLGDHLTPVPLAVRGGEVFLPVPYRPGLRPRAGRGQR
ncbi:Rieske 2Fe-2S domain-containing protein [uncultured Maritimibacter sp.]|uniref:Rieske (2Fe-2S) protein n=1 Tax=uncultured Maritimibacter sp. TaxID=991866 RepID=UPI0026319903|nr:Rieske 2Fe-2S domain-containing protein [uncultured Maritimibacter sp.]